MEQDKTSTADLIRALQMHKGALQRLGVRHLSIFGSRARGEAREDSDLDALVELASDDELGRDARDDVARGRAELAVSGTISEICGLDANVVERRRLTDDFARRIADDLIEVF